MLSSNVVPVEASEGSVSFLVSFQMAFLTTNLCVMLMRLGIWNTPRVTIAAGHNWKWRVMGNWDEKGPNLSFTLLTKDNTKK